MNNPDLRDVIERNREQVMKMPGVVGVAVGLSKSDPTRRCIQVYVTTNDWPEGVPHQLDGFDVELVKTRGFRAT